ncbi:Parvalbumin [Trema orientale]|uniref:Parvalbumin n=1 Tax=Trema orientale TaxID=63057 RepID=A0A2P5E197_TREOI|nr:Parvalbumin [Trema orientale]
MTIKNNDLELSKEQLVDVFKSYDLDKDGKLSRKELRAAFQFLGSNCIVSYFRAIRALCTVGANNDGYISLTDENKLQLLIDYARRCGYSLIT